MVPVEALLRLPHLRCSLVLFGTWRCSPKAGNGLEASQGYALQAVLGCRSVADLVLLLVVGLCRCGLGGVQDVANAHLLQLALMRSKREVHLCLARMSCRSKQGMQ